MGVVITGTKNKILSDLVRVSKKFGEDAIYEAQTNYLSGPRPEKLAHKSGRLASSLRSRTDQDGNVISTTIGTNVVYAAIHEFGSDAIGGIKHPGGTAYFFNPKRGGAVWVSNKNAGAGWPPELRTRPHIINIPARPYLRPAIADALPPFVERISNILGEVNFTEGINAE